jgi:hypothetical protein
VEFRDGRIVEYSKQPTRAMRHIDYGLEVFHQSAFTDLPQCPCDLASLYQTLLARNELAAFEVPDRFYEIGSFEGIASLETFLSNPGGIP